jgi:hypothetical protein
MTKRTSETWEVDLVYLGGLVNQTNQKEQPVLGLLAARSAIFLRTLLGEGPTGTISL